MVKNLLLGMQKPISFKDCAPVVKQLTAGAVYHGICGIYLAGPGLKLLDLSEEFTAIPVPSTSRIPIHCHQQPGYICLVTCNIAYFSCILRIFFSNSELSLFQNTMEMGKTLGISSY